MPYAFAVDLGGTKCSAAVVDNKGRILFQRAVPVDHSSRLAPVRQIVELAEDLSGGKNPKDVFAAAAIAVPGLARPNGTVWAPNLPGWTDMPLASLLKRRLAIPVLVESDRNAAVLGECWHGVARGKSDVIVLMIGTGIGAGILSGGRIVHGAHELSGCAGWLTVTRERARHRRRNGELESLVSGPAIARAAKSAILRGQKSCLAQMDTSKITAHEVAAAARQSDRLALSIFHECGTLLGYGIANIVSLFDPEVVVLGGGMASAADLYLEPLKTAMLERAQPLAAKLVKVVISKLRDRVILLGCARLAITGWKEKR